MATPKRRLTNIRVKEVSLVDEAANLRRFIVVKRKGGSGMGKKNAELLKDDEGVLKLSADVKESLNTQGKDVITALQTTLEKINKVKTSEDAGNEVPGELIDEFDSVLKLFPKFTDDDSEGGEPKEDFGIAKIAEEIKKAGKKISSSRLEKINEAATILSKLIDELSGDKSDKSGDSSTKKAASSVNSHEGGNDMADEKTKKRSPQQAYTLAEAEMIKQREDLELAEENADQDGIKKAKVELEKAKVDLKKAEGEKADFEKNEGIKKAEAEATKAQEALKKAKGEDDTSDDTVALLKKLAEGQDELKADLQKAKDENAELKKKLDDVSKTAQPSNSASEDDNDSSGDKDVNKKYDGEFWGGVFS